MRLVSATSPYLEHIHTHVLPQELPRILATVIHHLSSPSRKIHSFSTGYPQMEQGRAMNSQNASHHVTRAAGFTQKSRQKSFLKKKRKTNLIIGKLVTYEILTNDKDAASSSSPSSETRFLFASWLSNTGLGMITRSAGTQVHRTLTTYNFVDPKAAIFKACATGDDMLLQQLVDNRDASPFDVTCDGVTPLHASLPTPWLNIFFLSLFRPLRRVSNSFPGCSSFSSP